MQLTMAIKLVHHQPSQQTNSSTDQRTGEGDNLPGNSKTRATIHLTGTAKEIFGSDPNWINVFGNIYGQQLVLLKLTNKVKILVVFPQDAFRKLINVTDLGQAGWNGQNINPNAPQVLAYIEGTDNSRQFAMTWAPNGMPSTRDIQNNVTGTVWISFNDGTYLDVKANINVVLIQILISQMIRRLALVREFLTNLMVKKQQVILLLILLRDQA